ATNYQLPATSYARRATSAACGEFSAAQAPQPARPAALVGKASAGLGFDGVRAPSPAVAGRLARRPRCWYQAAARGRAAAAGEGARAPIACGRAGSDQLPTTSYQLLLTRGEPPVLPVASFLPRRLRAVDG